MKRSLLCVVVVLAMTKTVGAGLILSDEFNYPDGSIVGADGSPWAHHSGTENQANIESGKLWLTQSESEDINAPLQGGPYLRETDAVLYASFTVSFAALPRGDGSYFAHFKGAGTQFGAKVFASTNNAAEGKFRLGISNSASDAGASSQLSNDLSLNSKYTVVIKHELQTGLSTIWLDPAAESDPHAVAQDAPSPITVASFAFRQALSSGDGMGELWIDDLKAGTSFADVTSRSLSLRGSIRFSDGAFELSIVGGSDSECLIQASTNLVSWRDLATVIIDDLPFVDPAAPSFDMRYYRAAIASAAP